MWLCPVLPLRDELPYVRFVRGVAHWMPCHLPCWWPCANTLFTLQDDFVHMKMKLFCSCEHIIVTVKWTTTSSMWSNLHGMLPFIFVFTHLTKTILTTLDLSGMDYCCSVIEICCVMYYWGYRAMYSRSDLYRKLFLARRREVEAIVVNFDLQTILWHFWGMQPPTTIRAANLHNAHRYSTAALILLHMLIWSNWECHCYQCACDVSESMHFGLWPLTSGNPPCQNNGSCYEGNTCFCTNGFNGTYCEIRKFMLWSFKECVGYCHNRLHACLTTWNFTTLHPLSTVSPCSPWPTMWRLLLLQWCNLRQWYVLWMLGWLQWGILPV